MTPRAGFAGNRTRFGRNRRGIVLMAVVVCLVAISTIVLGGLRQSLRLHRQVRHERMLEQTRWVLDAGISRAVATLKRDPEYPGETLVLETDVQNFKPSLLISVQAGETDRARSVHVIASLEPLDATTTEAPFQRSLKFQFITEPVEIRQAPEENQNP